MSNYLIHQLRDGTPVGVFTENNHYYFPNQVAHEKYGVAVVEGKGPDTTWDDWAEQLAQKSPSTRAMWDIYPHPQASLYQVLVDCRSDTTT